MIDPSMQVYHVEMWLAQHNYRSHIIFNPESPLVKLKTHPLEQITRNKPKELVKILLQCNWQYIEDDQQWVWAYTEE